MSEFILDEIEIFTPVHDVYPLIDPASQFANQTFKDKVVIITGGSVGIGYTTALFYARAGAKVVIVARRIAVLEEAKQKIEKEVKGAQVQVVAGDISEPELGKRVVDAAVKAWGRVDIVIANQFSVVGGPIGKLGDKDPAAWWNTQVVNVRGTLNIVHAALPELLKTKGQIIATTSAAAHARFPPFMDYSVSKHTLDRFIEILALDYPEISSYAVHPGAIVTPGATTTLTEMGLQGVLPQPDTVELAAATFLWLTGRNAEFLSGRYVQATWDLNEVLAKKDEIVRDNLLVTKLAGPAKSA
ncbi:unnamed protein product [Peniophora sp. CBMAI 1063]|nr:unnamed protein product [Peniophora sp. CBMAI 1063]